VPFLHKSETVFEGRLRGQDAQLEVG
jgi:hypothetical protein